MPRNLGTLAALALALLFFAGLAGLMQARFAVGDVFPPYSTHRADPLGTRALYESLARVPGMTVRRTEAIRFQPAAPQGMALLFLGVGVEDVMEAERNDVDDLDGFVASGGRLVMTFLPTTYVETNFISTNFARRATAARPAARQRSTNTPEVSPGAGANLRWMTLFGRWQVGLAGHALASNATAVATKAAAGLDPRVPWHSTLVFDQLGPQWKTLYERDGKPVVIETVRGMGSVVLAADSYFVSNEALFRDRCPGLLGVLPGNAREVVFDETHHGMVLRPGVTSLLRRFGLLGALAALLLTGGLLLWRWSSPFVVPPAEASADEAGVINGRAAAVGLVQLVRRHLPASRLAALCVDEWCRTFAARPGTRASDLEAPVREVLARAGRRPHPVAVYRAVCELLKENRWKP